MAEQQKRVIALFDVDMTLTPARSLVTPEMLETIAKMRAKGIDFGIVSGSDLVKVREQMTPAMVDAADWCFAENGLDAYKLGVEVEKQSINKHLGEDSLKRLINFILHYIADLDIPIKRGTFIEFRNGMINVSPIGRNCSKQERNEFEEFDKTAGVRKAFVETLRREFADMNLRFSIGGQISFDVFPIGWDKSFCLKFIEGMYDEVHFWGDKTAEGGNDHEIYIDSRTIGHAVVNPDETIVQVKETFGLE